MYTRFLRLGIILSTIAMTAAVMADSFVVPKEAKWANWEAEGANATGNWQAVSDPSASGGTYRQTDDPTATLQYHFKAERETTLRVRPVWWRTSQTRSGRRFPYPLPQSFGPEALQVAGDKVLFLSPAGRSLGSLEVGSGRLNGVPLGGYPTDIAYDAATNRAYVTDATGSCVLVLSPMGEVTQRMKTAAQPWALALVGGNLYVACREGKCVQTLDAKSGAVLQTLPLEAEPVGLEVVGNPATALTVRFQQSSLQMQSLELMEPDQVQYNLKAPRGYAGLAKDKRYEVDPAKQVLKVAKAGVSTTIDTSTATSGGTGAAPANLPGYAPPSAGPSAPLLAGDKLFFTVPAAGRVGVVDTKTDKIIKVLEVGGCPLDLATAGKGEKVYVADAATSTVLVIDTAKLEVMAKISVPTGPTSLQVAETYNLQRPYMVPGLPINRLFVACYGDKSVGVIDLKTDKLVQTVPLGYRPRNLKVVPSPNPDWWPTLADDRIPFGMLPKLAVEPIPVTVDLATGEAKAATEAGEGIARRNSVKLTVGGAEKTITSNGNMVLQIAAPVDKGAPPIGGAAAPTAPRNLDCSSLCDPQRGAQAALQPEDEAGSITVSIDGGPDFDWRSGLWTRPDNGGFLVYDTEEYWQWNAPRFRVKPGDHVVTIKAKDKAVRLDAVAVEPTAEGALEVSVRPEPWSVHSEVPSGAYQGVFYDTEPVKFTVGVANATAQKQTVTVSGSVTNTMGVLTALLESKPLEVEGANASSFPLALDLKETGRFTLTLTAHSEGGDVTRDFRFVRLPKLEHPRLFFRADEEQAIRQRIAAHPVLFKRYAQWLVRMTAKEGKFPERFLPNGLTQAELALAAPEGSKNPGQEWGWRMYELGWRMMGVQFASRYVPGADKATLDARLKPLLTAPTTNTWVQYHHHGPFFPGAVEGMVDMAAAEQRAGLPLTSFFAKHKGDMNVYPFTLLSLEEPLSLQDRALIYRIAIQHDNLESYYTAHAGNRGGTWWQNPWSWCYCPTQGLFLSEMFTANFLGERRWAEKPFFRGYLTFMQQADPLSDKASLLPALRRPSGEPWRFILTAVSRHPLEKAEYGWDEWLRKMEGPLPNEGQAVDELMALKGRPLAGPLEAAPHRFATAISVPVAVALGWYDPQAPTVEWQDLPPTTIMNPEGWARLRSGWSENDTELWFMSGVRDHTTRHQPNHFMVARNGRFLVGTGSLWADDGNCSPSWGNTVVAGNQWLLRWQTNLNAPRSEEKDLIDRFSPANWSYLGRERSLNGYAPAESGWGGGTDLHGHTETLMMDDGRITGYETWPEFDYVAGETTGAWPVDEIRSHQRQLVFFKPNIVVIYDRVRLGPNGHPSRWLAATGPKLAIDGKTFAVTNEDVRMNGQVLLPREAKVEAIKPFDCYPWKGQQMLQISTPDEGNETEYLVVMTTGGQRVPQVQATMDRRTDIVNVSLSSEGRQFAVAFNRRGPVGGAVAFARGGRQLKHDLPFGVEDTYRNWNTDPRFRSWVTQPRFEFIIPECDRVR